MAGLALGACGAKSGPATTSTSVSASTPTTTTVTTATHTVVGTTPLGETVTETSTDVTTTPVGPDGVTIEAGAPLGATTTSATATATVASTTITGQTIDGVQCARVDQLSYQAYAHLQVYVDGAPRQLPGAIGLISPNATATGTTTTYRQGLCSYWVLTRAANGVIEIHSPVARTYTLGELFDIWGQPLSSVQVADARGRVSASVDGRTWHGSPRAIPLREHESIQLAVGRPVPRYQPVDWSETDL